MNGILRKLSALGEINIAFEMRGETPIFYVNDDRILTRSERQVGSVYGGRHIPGSTPEEAVENFWAFLKHNFEILVASGSVDSKIFRIADDELVLVDDQSISRIVGGTIYRQKDAEKTLAELYAFAKEKFDADFHDLPALGAWIIEQFGTTNYHSKHYQELIEKFKRAA